MSTRPELRIPNNNPIIVSGYCCTSSPGAEFEMGEGVQAIPPDAEYFNEDAIQTSNYCVVLPPPSEGGWGGLTPSIPTVLCPKLVLIQTRRHVRPSSSRDHHLHTTDVLYRFPISLVPPLLGLRAPCGTIIPIPPTPGASQTKCRDASPVAPYSLF